METPRNYVAKYMAKTGSGRHKPKRGKGSNHRSQGKKALRRELGY